MLLAFIWQADFCQNFVDIIADEPTGALDSKTSEEILTLFQQLNNEGVTIIFCCPPESCFGCFLPLSGKPTFVRTSWTRSLASFGAIVNRPSFIIADEPTGALDSKTSEEILTLFQQLNNEGVTKVVLDASCLYLASRLLSELRGHDLWLLLGLTHYINNWGFR
jgi:predicted ABC-type transport system involved in lysophospholipase L1 biosynthesis ATPase subunit